MERSVAYSWGVFYDYTRLKAPVNCFSVNYENKVHQLWKKHLEEYDKRSFREYFIEEHGFDIGENISIEALTKLCELIK